MVLIDCSAIILLLGLVTIGASADLEVFKQNRDELFGSSISRLYFESVRDKLYTMIKLIEVGEVPVEVQGDQTLINLRPLVDDCSLGNVCDLEVDFQKLDRLDKAATSNPNLNPYLMACKNIILEHCSATVYGPVKSKFVSFEQPNLEMVVALAKQFAEIEPRYNSAPADYMLVLCALKKVDPKGSKAVTKKWTHRTKAAKEFISQVRQSCDAFLDRYDPLVDCYPPSATAVLEQSSSASPVERLTRLHFYADICKKVVAGWDAIMKDAMRTYEQNLAEPKLEQNYDGILDAAFGPRGSGSTVMMGGAAAVIG